MQSQILAELAVLDFFLFAVVGVLPSRGLCTKIFFANIVMACRT